MIFALVVVTFIAGYAIVSFIASRLRTPPTETPDPDRRKEPGSTTERGPD